jgi:transcriptional regulator of heat shock response
VLSLRTGTVLKSIVRQYIIKAVPVPSQGLMEDYELGVSHPETIIY